MNKAAAKTALSHWDMGQATIALIAQRENIVYKVERQGDAFALRLHRPGYQTTEMIRSELVWMQHLASRGIAVPVPLASRFGSFLVSAAGYHADLLTWLPGHRIGATGTPLQLADRTGTFFNLGTQMAQVHNASDNWEPPMGFTRFSWDIDGLLGETPVWGRFWDNPGLNYEVRELMLAARKKLRADLQERAQDFGLIHADMIRENVMINGDRIGLIDFDDCGFGFRLFDVATALIKNRSEPDYPVLKSAFLDGYRSLRPLNTDLLPQFLLIRALSYLGWIITRMNEPGASERQQRFLSTSLPMLETYLATYQGTGGSLRR